MNKVELDNILKELSFIAFKAGISESNGHSHDLDNDRADINRLLGKKDMYWGLLANGQTIIGEDAKREVLKFGKNPICAAVIKSNGRVEQLVPRPKSVSTRLVSDWQI
jgi:hypothetical protein